MGYAAFAERFKGRDKAVVGGSEAVRGEMGFVYGPFEQAEQRSRSQCFHR